MRTTRRTASRRGAGGALLLLVAAGLGAGGCADGAPRPRAGGDMNEIAESYVKLVLSLGRHDEDYVDAYLGPPEWQSEAAAAAFSLDEIADGAERAAADLATLGLPPDEPDRSRYRHLEASFRSLLARIAILRGSRLSFDEESRALYDAVAPALVAEHFQAALDRLGERLPGEGPVAQRYEAYRQRFVIPPERLDAVFQAAIEACRERTVRHLELPAEESFSIEYVTDKPWSGYNWYQGGFRSLIQVNTDLPIHIDRALDLACHEGYPGHHVYSLLGERDLVRGREWMEFSVYPLFSPRSLIAEGTANFGIEVAFPAGERVDFERRVLFPLAGLDPGAAADYYEAYRLARELGYAGNEAARRFLDGSMSAAEAVRWLTTYALMPEPRAEQRLRFIERYRSYVINYNLGQDLVRGWVEARGGSADDPVRRWAAFSSLLTTPILPSDLARSAP